MVFPVYFWRGKKANLWTVRNKKYGVTDGINQPLRGVNSSINREAKRS